MTELFRVSSSRNKPGKVELISVHIPKTAGTSFRNYLKAVYSPDSVARVDLPLESQVLKYEQKAYGPRKLPKNVRVVHGHFNLLELQARLDLPDSVPVITWLRHPVDRVISNYFYLKARLEEELDEKGKGLNILSKMQRTLLEYARAEPNRNRQSNFLRGMSLRDFDFVGIQEHFKEDIAKMARHFLWDPSVDVPKVNVTPRRYAVSEAEREEIMRLNQADMRLYEEGLRLRAQRNEPLQPELISIHLPKTAGTSFFSHLKTIYGPDLTLSFTRKNIARAQQYFGSSFNFLNCNIKALHGHFRYLEVSNLHKQYSPKLVCWLRDPVERVISNYLYHTRAENFPNSRKTPDLMAYANRAEAQNKMSWLLEGIALEEFFFIGFQEQFEEDLRHLGRLMSWPEVPTHTLNVSEPERRSSLAITSAMKEELARLNSLDVALYQRARTLRVR